MPRRSTALVVALCAVLLGLVGCAAANGATSHDPMAWHESPDDPGVSGAAGGETPAPDAASSAPATGRPSASAGVRSAPSSGNPGTTPTSSATLRGSGLQLSVNTMAGGGVALTFDDGPSAKTPQLLDILKQHQVKATFCVVGQMVHDHPDIVRRIVAEGHTLCNHSWNHDEHLGRKAPEAIRADLQKTNDEIHRAVPGAAIKYFRHPGGNFTVAAVEVCQGMGMTPLGWTVDPTDWDTRHNKPGPAFTQHITTVVRRGVHAGSIVLSHDGGGDRSSTVAAYRTLVPELKNTYQLLPLPTS